MGKVNEPPSVRMVRETIVALVAALEACPEQSVTIPHETLKENPAERIHITDDFRAGTRTVALYR